MNMNEKSWTKPKDLNIVFTAEMFEDLNAVLIGISKRTLMGSTYQYADGRIMRVLYMEDGACKIELYK